LGIIADKECKVRFIAELRCKGTLFWKYPPNSLFNSENTAIFAPYKEESSKRRLKRTTKQNNILPSWLIH